MATPRRASPKAVPMRDLSGKPFQRSVVRRSRDMVEFSPGPQLVAKPKPPGPRSSRARRSQPGDPHRVDWFVPTVKLDPSQVTDLRGVYFKPRPRPQKPSLIKHPRAK